MKSESITNEEQSLISLRDKIGYKRIMSQNLSLVDRKTEMLSIKNSSFRLFSVY